MSTTETSGKPKTITWHGDGIYSKTRAGQDGQPIETYFVRVWCPGERKMRTWKAGFTPRQAQRKLRQLRGDPDAAAAKRKAAQEAIKRFARDYGAKYPKAVASLRRDEAEQFTFFEFPADHWQNLRTTNVIESPFATVRLRQRVTKGAGSRAKGLLMVFKLLEMAQKRWRRINGAHVIPLVRAEVRFIDGEQAERRSEPVVLELA